VGLVGLSDVLYSQIENFAKNYVFFSSDSRNLQENSLFIALQGAQTDGHSYVAELLQRDQKIGVIVEDNFLQQNPELQGHKQLLSVPSTPVAHRALARIFRLRSQAKVVAIGGSSGKTSTKEFLYQILSRHFKTVVTQKSQNGELGIPKTLESLRPDTELVLIEVGIDRPNDMARHMDVVQPDWGVLTSIGEEHLLYLENLETVFKEETILFENVWQREGLCFAPKADPFLKKLKNKKNLILTPENTTDLNPVWKNSLTHPLAQRNATLAACVAQHLQLSEKDIEIALKELIVPEGRGRILTGSHQKQVIVADHYNSNPASLRAGLVYLQKHFREKKYLVLGDMRELGPNSLEFHKQLLEEALQVGAQGLCLVGEEFVKAAESLGISSFLAAKNSVEATQVLADWKNVEGVIFVKGSRGIQLEKVVNFFHQDA
jgi:UDP-N-acetylmuramoyl-tripeptide--D-alanyl-D-alanine ligase